MMQNRLVMAKQTLNIFQKNLTKIATEIRNVFGSLQNNQALNEYAKNNKIKDNIKKILFE